LVLYGVHAISKESRQLVLPELLAQNKETRPKTVKIKNSKK
jgi:hypothetical protein